MQWEVEDDLLQDGQLTEEHLTAQDKGLWINLREARTG